MNSYRYRMTVEQVADERGQPLEVPKMLQFSVANHDDLLRIVAGVRGRDLPLSRALDENEATAVAVGLKLLSEVALMHRREGLFAEVHEALRAFSGRLKASPEVAATAR